MSEFRDVFKRFYRPPLGLPLRWQDEQSGLLPTAVWAYYNHVARPATHPEPTRDQMSLVLEYVRYYIEAPCWQGADGLADLRTAAAVMKSAEDLDRWIWMCLEIGIDPL